MKRCNLIIVLLLTVVILLTGCSGGNSVPVSSTEPTQSSDPSLLKVGLLLPGTINDQGWNALAYDAIKSVEKKLDVETVYIENVSQSDMQEQFELLASQGYKVVFGHGFQFGDAAVLASKNYPDTWFVLTSSDLVAPPNVLSVNMSNLNAGFVLGCVAAMVSETGTVGYVSGEKFTSFTDFGEGYQQGVNYINPNAKLLVVYTESNSDAALAKEASLAQIDQGADVITANCNEAALGSIEACDEKGITALGYPADQSEGNACILMSGVENQAMLFELIVRKAIAGELECKFYELGFEEGACYLAWTDNADVELIEKTEKIIDKINNGEITVTRLP